MKKLLTLAALCFTVVSAHAGPGAPGNNPDYVLGELPNGDYIFMHYDTRDELFGRFGKQIRWRLPMKNFLKGAEDEEPPLSFEQAFSGTTPDKRVFLLSGQMFAQLRAFQSGKLIARLTMLNDDQYPVQIGTCRFSPDSTRLAIGGMPTLNTPNVVAIFDTRNGNLLQRFVLPNSLNGSELTWQSPTQLRAVYFNSKAYDKAKSAYIPGVPTSLIQMLDVPIPPPADIVPQANDDSVITVAAPKPTKPAKRPKKTRRTPSKRRTRR